MPVQPTTCCWSLRPCVVLRARGGGLPDRASCCKKSDNAIIKILLWHRFGFLPGMLNHLNKSPLPAPLPNPPALWRPTKYAPVYVYGCEDDERKLVIRVVAPCAELTAELGEVQHDSFDLCSLRLTKVNAEVITPDQLPPEAVRGTAKCGLRITSGTLVADGRKARTSLRRKSTSKAACRAEEAMRPGR